MSTLNVKEIAEKWGISENKVRELCRDGKIVGAEKTSADWTIPEDAQNPLNNNVQQTETAETTATAVNSSQGNEVVQTFGVNSFFGLLVKLFGMLVGVGLVVGGVVLVIEEKGFFFGVILVAFGALICMGVSKLIKLHWKNFKIRWKDEKAAGIKTLRKEVTKFSLCMSALVVVGVTGLVLATAVTSARRMNSYAEQLLKEPIDSYVFEEIEEYDEKIKSVNKIGEMFFTKKNQVEKFKAEAQALITDRAEEINAEIAALTPVTSLNSTEQYNEIRSKISNIQLDDDSAFDAKVKEHITDYSTFETYKANFDKLCESCKITCGSCHGDGGSSKTTSCSSCYGRGKIAVKWYSEGDWGEVSYTSYTCKSCNGKGRKTTHQSCKYCGGDGFRFTFEENKSQSGS